MVLLGVALPASARDDDAIKALVQQQVQTCWNLPAGYEGQVIRVNLVLRGDGAFEGAPEIAPDSVKAAAKLEPLASSAIRAIQRCAPFTGFEALELDPGEHVPVTLNFVG